jgi:hypothetical protein
LSDLSKSSRRTKTIAMLIVFTALYTVLRFIPYTILIGGTGGFLWLSDLLPPIFGILLGPYVGGLSILMGSFLAIGFGHSVTFLGLDFLPDLVSAVAIGFLVRRKWAPVVLLNAALLLIFFLDPLTSFFVTIPHTAISIPFAWMHIVAFVVLLSPLSRKAARWVDAALQPKLVGIGLVILAFIGTIMQHLTGNILFEFVFGQIGNPPIIPVGAWPGEWTLVVLAYPVERSILILSAFLIGTPLILILSKNPYLRNKK